MTIGELGQLLTGIAVLGSWLTSLRNGRKLNEVHNKVNGLSERNEGLAREAGVAQGKQSEKDNPSE